MRIFFTVVLVTGMSLVLRGASPQASVSLHSETVREPTARFALQRAMGAALARLERAECRKVFSDFRDATGRTLQAHLDLLGETPRSYVARIAFREGLDRQRCRDATVLAFTSVGRLEVFICSPQFWQTYRQNPSHVEALLIHELMHTLGLGENPPSSAEITARVVKRCW